MGHIKGKVKKYKCHLLFRVIECKKRTLVFRVPGQLIVRYAESTILFSNEKRFQLQKFFNSQNNRIYAVTLQKAWRNKGQVQSLPNVPQIMVWGAISVTTRRTDLRRSSPNIKKVFGKDHFCFHQDSAPAHNGKRTLK